MNHGYGPPGGGNHGHPAQGHGHAAPQGQAGYQHSPSGYGQPPGYAPQGQGHYPQPQPGYGQAHGYGQSHQYAQAPQAAPADPDRGRRIAGLIVWILGMLLGIGLNIFFHMANIFLSKSPGKVMGALVTGAIWAFVPLVLYLFVPAILDRFDPEPWWCLAMAFLWGALVATGVAGTLNTLFGIVAAGLFGPSAGNFLTAVISAPLVEEFWKGLAVFGFFFFLRREFDGVVDGIIYATFCALGFAAVENVDYYARASLANQLGETFFIRGVIAPWGHPLYTAMIGIGFGLARESTKTWVRICAPLGGYFAGVTLHFIWNLSCHLGAIFILMLGFWLLFVVAFLIIVIVLVAREGRIIREHLKDEVLMGTISQEELDLVCSPFGRLQCTFGWRGSAGREFIRTAAKLALAKWHAGRAMKGQKRTISIDFIGPLRQEMGQSRAEMNARA